MLIENRNIVMAMVLRNVISSSKTEENVLTLSLDSLKVYNFR
jgi:hypothetical protein